LETLAALLGEDDEGPPLRRSQRAPGRATATT
jgi:hypothetical protein